MPLRIANNSPYVEYVINDLLMISQSPSLIIDILPTVITDPDTGENQIVLATGYVNFLDNDPLESSLGTNMLYQIINSKIDVLIRPVPQDCRIPSLDPDPIELKCNSYNMTRVEYSETQGFYYGWSQIYYTPVRTTKMMYRTAANANEFEPMRSNVMLFHELAHVKATLDGVVLGLDPIAAGQASQNAVIGLENQYLATLPDHPPARAMPGPDGLEELICDEELLCVDSSGGVPCSDTDATIPDAPYEPLPAWNCFIASVVYGTSVHRDVLILRAFRDQVLMKTVSGRFVAHVYNRIGPVIADVIRPLSTVRTAIRYMIKPVVWLAKRFVGDTYVRK